MVPHPGWYGVSVAATLAVLWRYGPVYGLTPVRDLAELIRFVVLPDAGLALAYSLALFPLVARFVRRPPAWLVLGGGATVAVLGAATAARLPELASAAVLTRHLLFFLIGWVLGYRFETLATKPAPAMTRALARIGDAAAPIAAALVPVTAASGAVLVRRLSTLDGPAQLAVAVAEPILLTAAIVVAGMVARRLSRRWWRIALATVLFTTSAGCAPRSPDPAPDVVLAFGGDVHFEGRIRNLLSNHGSVFGQAGPLLKAADLAVVNLETPVTLRDDPQPKRYAFRADPPAAEALHAAGIDAVSLANNHSMDHGRAGLTDTITNVRAARVGVFGAGQAIDEALRPWRTQVHGVRIAVFGFSQVAELADTWAAGPLRAGIAMAFDLDRAARAVAAARADSDLVVVMPHWGVEGDPCPSREQQTFAQRMADAGADIVVGAHAHVLQGAGHLDDTFVAYGLGNLLWYSSGLYPPFSARSGVLTLTVRGRTVVRSELAPVLTSESGRPRLLTGWRADLARENYSQLSTCAQLRR